MKTKVTPKPRKAVMKKNTKYIGGKRLNKDEEVLITEKYMGHQRYEYTATRPNEKTGTKVTRSEFEFTENQKFIVTVSRVSYSTRNIEVEALDRDKAMNLADEKAGDLEFKEDDAKYEILGVMTQDELDSYK